MEHDSFKWIFSGIGVFAISVIFGMIWRYRYIIGKFILKNESEIINVVDLTDATNFWSGFVGDLYCWNPSWQTELVTKPSEWDGIHKSRYLDEKLERVVYIVAKTGPGNRQRKFFYLSGMLEFLNKFCSEHPELEVNIKSKMDVYIQETLPSDLSFFIGTRENSTKPVGILLINDEPFCDGDMPVYAFVTSNKKIIKDMQNMIHTAMVDGDKTQIYSILDIK